MSTKRPLDAFIARSRAEAEAAAMEREAKRIQTRRDHEKWLRERGMPAPWSDLVLEDVRRMEKEHPERYELATEIPEFRARVQALRTEAQEAIDRVTEAGDEAAMTAGANPPEDVLLLESQAGEIDVFLARHGIAQHEVDEKAAHVAEEFRQLREKHARELRDMADRAERKQSREPQAAS